MIQFQEMLEGKKIYLFIIIFFSKFFIIKLINIMYNRAMERENKKFRSDGRKEYIDSIRQLVAFIKRLDERAIKIEKESKIRRQQEKELLEQRRLDDINKKKDELMKKLEKFEMNQDEIIRSQEERGRSFVLDNDYDDLEYFSYTMNDSISNTQINNSCTIDTKTITTNNNEIKLNEPIIYNCKICNKEFLTDKQLEQHNNSKQHKQKDKEERNKLKTKVINPKYSIIKKEPIVDIEKLIDAVINGEELPDENIYNKTKNTKLKNKDKIILKKNKKDSKDIQLNETATGTILPITTIKDNNENNNETIFNLLPNESN